MADQTEQAVSEEEMIHARQAVGGAAYSQRNRSLAAADDVIRRLWIEAKAGRAALEAKED